MPYRKETEIIQEAVASLGHDVGTIDGKFGPDTLAGVQSWLAARGEPKATLKSSASTGTLAFAGQGKKLDDIDLPRVGEMIGVGEDEIHAVIDVETAGGGFDSKGRVRMLFEPHVFWRELGVGAKRNRAEAAGLAYPKWGTRSYPRDSYPRLEAAMEIDEGAALRSASWGLGQIMGFNCKLAGYNSARAMVEAFVDDEENHLEAMVQFIISTGLDDELRRHDWAGFAKDYNGAGYAKHGYHTKLARAYARWARIPDTPYPKAA